MVIEDPVIYTVLCLMVNPHRASAATLALLLPLDYIQCDTWELAGGGMIPKRQINGDSVAAATADPRCV